MEWTTLLATAFLAGLTARVWQYRADLKAVCHLPGMRPLFSPWSLPGALLPTSFFNPGLLWMWYWRKYAYNSYGKDTISCVPLFHGAPIIYTTSINVSKQVLNALQTFYKSDDSVAPLAIWGDNVISTNGDAWKRHRKIVGPAFGGSTYVLVAQETARLYYEMVDAEGWSQQQVTTMGAVNHLMSKFALGVVTRAGFGIPFTWMTPERPKGEMSFEEAIIVVSEGNIIRAFTPKWAYKLPIERLRRLAEAYRQLEAIMAKLILQKRQSISPEMGGDSNLVTGNDLFTRLIQASESDGGQVLDESELVSNVFAFLFAGHETTAHALVAAIGMLALYNDEQDKVREQVLKVLVDGRDPTFDDYASLNIVLACFQEAARMFTPPYMVTRTTTETTRLAIPPEDGGGDLILPPGMQVIIDMIGLHYNPTNFPDPEAFRPTRWLGVPESEQSFFGFGPRACVGRKFATTEATCFLALLLRDWVLEPIMREGESGEAWRERVMQGAVLGMTLGVRDVPVRLRRRERERERTSLYLTCEQANVAPRHRTTYVANKY